MKRISYEKARDMMQVGDVIAFGGDSHFSGIVKAAIRAEVSHIGILLRTQLRDEESGETFNSIIDSTARQHVKIHRLEQRIDEYRGDVWWLRLRQDLREHSFDERAFYDFLTQQEGKKYDQLQAAGSAIDFWDNAKLPFGLKAPGNNTEDYARFFCSELVSAGLKAAGMLPQSINASEVTPGDICRWKIFEPEYYLLKGEDKKLSGYNSLEPANYHTKLPSFDVVAP